MTVQSRRIDFLRRADALRHAPDMVLAGVADALEVLHFDAGEVVCREGEPGDRFFVVQSGTLAATTDVGGQERELGRMFAGDFLGEIALLGEAKRTATVKAVTDAELLSLSAQDFAQLLKEVPNLAEAVSDSASRRRSRSLRTELEVDQRNLAGLLEKRPEVSIGRATDNDLIFGSLNVAEHHAKLRSGRGGGGDGGGVELVDLGSGAGTFVNGTPVKGTRALSDGDQVVIGDQRFLFDRSGSVKVVAPHGIRIDLIDVRKTVRGDRTLLHDIDLSILPGEFVAIVGGSGAGKTTLMDAMAGLRPATSGTVLYNGRDYYKDIDQYRHVLGYVPQDDIIHKDMTVRRTLRYAAQLRLPRDTTSEHIEDAVDSRLAELGLGEREDVIVDKLSGGQRKRASIAIELLSEPRVLYLDEPTSGLDPATEFHMMKLLRRLADDGRTVVLTTHATKNVGLCDKIVVLARNGHLAYVGPPPGALAYFGVEDFDEIYDKLDEGQPGEWSERFDASPERLAASASLQAGSGAGAGAGEVEVAAAPRRGGPRQLLHQLKVLSARNLHIHRKPQNLMPLLMQPVVLSLLILALFKPSIWDPATRNAATAMQLVYTFDFVMFLFGLLFGAQEMVKETPIFRRERTVDLRVLPYLLSKAAFLAPLLALVATAMTALFYFTDRLPPDAGADVYVPLWFTLVLTGWAGMGMSLLISSAVKTSQQATDLLTPWIAPQVLFAGALLAVPAMGFVGRVLASITAVRWSFEASAQATNLKDLFRATNEEIGDAMLIQYADSFNWAPGRYWLILGAFVLVPLVLASVVLTKKSSRG